MSVLNRQAHFNYTILETIEAGLVLRGAEVKSIRAGQVSLQDAFVKVREGEAWLMNCHIAPYSHANTASRSLAAADSSTMHAASGSTASICRASDSRGKVEQSEQPADNHRQNQDRSEMPYATLDYPSPQRRQHPGGQKQ